MRRKRRGQHDPGPIRWRLAALLEAKGIIVSPYDLWTQEGFYRSRYHDLARWGTSDAKYKDGKALDGKPWTMKVHLSSWSTMTACVRYGIEVSQEDSAGYVSVEHVGRPAPQGENDQ